MTQDLITNIQPENNLPENNLHICFELDKKKYAVPSDGVIEIIMLPALNIPQKLPPNIAGILNYNGILINVTDIRQMLNLPVKKYDISSRIIIIKGEESLMAFIADSVCDVFFVEPEHIQPTSFDLSNGLIKSFYNCHDHVINILNLNLLEAELKASKSGESNLDSATLFPQDEHSLAVMEKRSAQIASKVVFSLQTDFFGKDKYVLFDVNSHYYCLYSEFVKELISLKNFTVTKIPYTPAFIKGIINIKGDFYTLISLKEYIGFDSLNGAVEDKIIVLEVKDLKLAFLVDSIIDVINISKDNIRNKNDIRLDDLFVKAEIYIDDKVYNMLNIDKLTNDRKLYIE